MEERIKELVEIAIKNLILADKRGYSSALSSAEIIFELVKKNCNEKREKIRQIIDIIILAEEGRELRSNVIKKIEEFYNEV